jgi:hypothetical protein
MRDFEHIRQTVNAIDEDVVTLYLHVDPGERANQSTPRGWEIYMKSALNDIEKNHIDNADNNRDWKALRSRIEEFARDYNPEGGQSLVMFVGNDTFHTHEIRVALDNSHSYGDPMIVPLLWAVDEHEQYLVVLVDQEQARLLNVYLGRATVNDEIELDIQGYDFRERNYINSNRGLSYGNVQGQGAGNDRFEDMKDEHIKRFYKDVASELHDLTKQTESTRLILSGNQQSAHALKDNLPQPLKDMMVDIVPMPVESADHDVVKRIRQTALNYEREQELELVNEVIGFAKSEGRGALGADAVDKALEMQQVEMLILPWPPQDADLAKTYTLAAMKNGSRVELVHGAPALKLRGEGAEVAARLYYYIGDKPTEGEHEEAAPGNG